MRAADALAAGSCCVQASASDACLRDALARGDTKHHTRSQQWHISRGVRFLGGSVDIVNKCASACARRVRLDTSSLSKYASVVREVGDWDWLQRLLAALSGVARRHGVSVADVAQRWVLERPQARRGNFCVCIRGRVGCRFSLGLRTRQHRPRRCGGCVSRRRSRRCHSALRPAASSCA